LKPREPEAPSNPASGASEPDELAAQVARAQAGDEAAFAGLVERHRDRAYGLALRILRSGPDAEDVAQEAFVRAWQALPRFRGEASFSTWLYRIVARQSFDRLAQLKRRRERETDLTAAMERAAGGGAGEVDAAWRARRVERMMAALPPAQRAAVTLFYYEDRSVEQVAETLGMPENTVKTHLSRARAALREAWTRGEGSAA
jgi:RNA polymerase sigma-70 factor (ECF subfamily)